MRRNVWAALVVCVAFLLSVTLSPRAAFSQKSLFEEEEEEAPEKEEVKEETAGATINVPRTAEARKLAGQVLSRIAKAYFNIISTEVPGFKATFTVKAGTKSAGTMTVSWNRKGNELSVDAEKIKDDDIRSMAEELVGEKMFKVLVEGPLGAAAAPSSGVYAVKSGDKYILDSTQYSSKEDSDVQAHISFVPADLIELNELQILKGGDIFDTLYKGQSSDKKLFVSSTTFTVREGEKQIGKAEYTCTYTRKEGTPFLRRIKVEATGDGETTSLEVTLSKVTFEEVEATEEEEEGTEAEEEEKDIEAEDEEKDIKSDLQLKIKELEEIRDKALRDAMEELRKELEKETTK